MEFGLGLPISDPARLPEWARLAEEHRFATVALLDRLAYDNPEPLTALAVLAGATTRIRLQTEVLLGPLRSTALLAKQVATLDRMSAGRFVLGIGIGGREDDHAAAGVPLNRRGRLLDTQLADLRSIWRGDPYRAAQSIGDGAKRDWGLGPTESGAAAAIGPRPAAAIGPRPAAVIGPRPVTAGGPPILIGGFAPEALRRVAQFADGFICAAPLTWADGLVRTVNEQWEQAGRAGRPRLVCQINTAVGSPGTVERGRRAVADYYAFTGRPGWGAPLSDPALIAETVAAYHEFGADELIFYCYGDDPRQVELLAGIVSG
ncbi:luciferase [Actinoplanes cyaneus]|uniref:Luciferase n=1 Tax=Actinoplanes cyaneus TaxID=52696 RepID=A0A919IEN1_9ACTN|nr:LLM class flavin-dependent oxidoreductase [Actinoplanes cyaneus]MCW2136465.1 Flavin-dependent oxidoreductase, luciferase family (includes alkanesulfonate monooxygenase SsuD and methylene tetrahydromethanopterin reductase) [Actinoplanes cyaneus]GID64389.1 luciferase [Actinoplanes cyaneus]